MCIEFNKSKGIFNSLGLSVRLHDIFLKVQYSLFLLVHTFGSLLFYTFRSTLFYALNVFNVVSITKMWVKACMTFLPAHHLFKVTVANIFTVEALGFWYLIFVLIFSVSTKDWIETHVTSLPANNIVRVTFTQAIDNDLAIIILFLFNLFFLLRSDIFLLFLLNLSLLLFFNLFLLFYLNVFILVLFSTLVVIVVITILNTITLATSAGTALFTCHKIASI